VSAHAIADDSKESDDTSEFNVVPSKPGFSEVRSKTGPELPNRQSQRSPMTERLAIGYWRFSKQLVREGDTASAIRILNLLITSDGVPDTIRSSAKTLLANIREDIQDEAFVVGTFPAVEFGVSISTEGTYNGDAQFDGFIEDRSVDFGLEFGLSNLLEFNGFVATYFELSTTVELNDTLSEQFEDGPEIERGSMWLNIDYSNDLFDDVIIIGTQPVSTNSTWWWEDELDLVALFFKTGDWSLTGATGVEVVDRLFGEEIDPEDKDVARVFGDIKWQYKAEHSVSVLYFGKYDLSTQQRLGDLIISDKSDDVDETLSWFGINFNGVIDAKSLPIQYWFDFAKVVGQETLYDFEDIDDETVQTENIEKYEVDGWGLNTGVSLFPELPGEPVFTVAYTTTSADENLDDDIDQSFRQTGHQGGGFGALLNPEISNFSTLSLGVEFSLPFDGELSIFYHDFRQVVAADFIRDAELFIDVSGESLHIGRELDVAFEFSLWDDVEVSVSYAVFEAGEAVLEQQGNFVQGATIELSYDF